MFLAKKFEWWFNKKITCNYVLNCELCLHSFDNLPLEKAHSTVGQKKKKSTPSNLNTNYRREMKLVPVNRDYCLLSFDAFEFSLGSRLHGGSLFNFNFYLCKSPNLTTKSKVYHSDCLDTNFHNISDITLRVIRRRNYK